MAHHLQPQTGHVRPFDYRMRISYCSYCRLVRCRSCRCFTRAAQLTAQVPAALVAQGQTVGIAVQSADQQISNAQTLEVVPQSTQLLYLPLIRR
ncbi:MAG: hypothetical protein H0T53_16640 [Herpetosiphonaceae bacterium]|nr:hypothetical protein [Herpetosiphonaceae bacterium]